MTDPEVTGVTGRQRRKLVLVRHAKSAWPDTPDQERPLARRGLRDAPALGRWLRSAGYVPDLVVCSTARRAEETWQLAATELQAHPAVSWDERVYQASPAGLLDLIRQAPPETGTMLVVGHDPAIAGVALMLSEGTAPAGAAGPPPGALDRMRAKFPTAAAAVLEFTGPWRLLAPGRAQLSQFVTPRDIRSEPRDDK